MDHLLGTVLFFAFNYSPKGWMPCDGRLMQLSSHTALFSLLGTQYGGDGIQTFALPKIEDLNCVHQGQLRAFICTEGCYPSRAD